MTKIGDAQKRYWRGADLTDCAVRHDSRDVADVLRKENDPHEGNQPPK